VEHGSTSSRPRGDDARARRNDDAAGSSITVRVGPLAGACGFFVADDGQGFDTGVDDPNDLFDRGVTTAADGTGYGLAIVRDIAEAHGWTVTATTGDDGGARFEFRIPD
jgi:signal transduction histidine kinase